MKLGRRKDEQASYRHAHSLASPPRLSKFTGAGRFRTRRGRVVFLAAAVVASASSGSRPAAAGTVEISVRSADGRQNVQSQTTATKTSSEASPNFARASSHCSSVQGGERSRVCSPYQRSAGRADSQVHVVTEYNCSVSSPVGEAGSPIRAVRHRTARTRWQVIAR